MNKMVFERFMIVSNRSSVVTSYMASSVVYSVVYSVGGYIQRIPRDLVTTGVLG